MHIRELRIGEGLLWRGLRLKALADAPDAFGSTYEASVQRRDADWHEMVDTSARDPAKASLVAEIAGEPAGMAFCRIDEEDPSLGSLYSMWVDPRFRRRGVGRALVEFTLAWMAERGAETAELDVTETNAEASGLYRAAGFTDTGDRRPLREGSELRVVVMRRRL